MRIVRLSTYPAIYPAIFRVIFLAIFLTVLSSAIRAEDWIIFHDQSDSEYSLTNWQAGYLEVSVSRAATRLNPNIDVMRLDALNTADSIAFDKLSKLASLTPIHPKYTVNDLIAHEKISQAQFDKALNAASTLERKVTLGELGGTKVPKATVTLRLCFTSQSPACPHKASASPGLLEMVSAYAGYASHSPATEEKLSIYMSADDELANSSKPHSHTQSIEGAVILLDPASYSPTATIEIANPKGTVIFAAKDMLENDFYKLGQLKYRPSLKSAQELDYISENTPIYAAQAITADGRIILSSHDSAALMSLNLQNGNFYPKANWSSC